MAYMTGILPIKKYGTHSALNMFDEFSMIDPGPLARYVGFTENEVKKLCEQYICFNMGRGIESVERLRRYIGGNLAETTKAGGGSYSSGTL